MQAIIELALKQRLLAVILFVATLIGGVAAFRVLNIEAYPDPVPPLVDVITQSPGSSAEEVERYITIPIETQIAGLPNAHVLRSISLYGLSDVKLQFTFDYTYEEAVQQVLNRLSQLSGLPPNVSPAISPTSPIGEIYRYRLKGLQQPRFKDAAGLDLAASLPLGPRRNRCHGLGRQDQDI
jgi:heavy metal efflux system protein